MSTQEKIFITGLPRTGTTSICSAMLELGYKVAHTSYTDAAFEQAQVIADTPIFCDFEMLANTYPNAKFIHLTRDLELWLPSIKQLLNRMYRNVTRTDGGFNPTLKRCYQNVFNPLTLENINSDEFIANIYVNHQQRVEHCFNNNPQRFLTINIAKDESYTRLLDFLKIPSTGSTGFERVNVGGKITYWNSIKHPNKVDANLKIKS